MLKFQGKGKDSNKPAIVVLQETEVAVDFYGREFIIPKGSITKQFETLNKGWIIWHEPNGTGHVRDLG